MCVRTSNASNHQKMADSLSYKWKVIKLNYKSVHKKKKKKKKKRKETTGKRNEKKYKMPLTTRFAFFKA